MADPRENANTCPTCRTFYHSEDGRCPQVLCREAENNDRIACALERIAKVLEANRADDEAERQREELEAQQHERNMADKAERERLG